MQGASLIIELISSTAVFLLAAYQFYRTGGVKRGESDFKKLD